MSLKNISDKIILCFFILLLLLPFTTFNLEQNKISKNESRYLSSFPTILDVNGKISKTFSDDFQNWFKDNLGLRDKFIKLCSNIEYNIFNRPYTDGFEVGSDDWLYYEGDDNIEIVKSTYPNFGENELKIICENQIKLKNYLAKQGIEYVLLLTPSKISIYPEHIFNGFYNPSKTPADILADYLEKHSDIKIIRTKDALIKKKENSDTLLFYKSDSHWNSNGIISAYLELIKKLNNWNIITTPSIDFTIKKADTWLGDIARINYLNINEPNYAIKFNAQSTHTLIDNRHPIFTNPKVSGPVILAYGDSMNNDLMPLLAENVSQLFYMKKTHVLQSDINLANPSLLYYQIGERRLYELKHTNENLYTNFIFNKDNNSVTFFYYDDTKYKDFYIHVWPKDNYEKLIELKASRYQNDTWTVTLNLNEYRPEELLKVHFYGVDLNNTNNFIVENDYSF